MNADVVVIGSGFAGLSAAVRHAGAGVRVVVAEEAPRLGGRATAFVDRETGERVDNGQHVLFGCYRETYAFLKAIGTDNLAQPERRLRLTMAGSDGRSFELRCPSLPAPWHLVAGVLGWSALPLSDRLSALHLRRVFGEIRRDGAAAVAGRVTAGQTVSDWLRAHRQSAMLCRWLWHPLAVAALNQSPEEAAAAPFVRVLGELFGPRAEDSAVGLPRVPLDALYAEPARRFIEARDGRVLTKAPARVISADRSNVLVRAGDVDICARAVVVAVPWHAIGRVFEPDLSAPLEQILRDAAAVKSSPIVTVNLWLDGPGLGAPFVGLVDAAMHWAFDKRAIVGEAAHISVVASGADDLARLDNAAIANLAMDNLTRALPALRTQRLVRSVVVREHRATFSLAPGAPARPPSRTPIANVFLAGDWIDTGLPGTIEGAVLSGHRAADLVIKHLTT